LIAGRLRLVFLDRDSDLDHRAFPEERTGEADGSHNACAAGGDYPEQLIRPGCVEAAILEA
jgi:hypothetical protein